MPLDINLTCINITWACVYYKDVMNTQWGGLKECTKRLLVGDELAHPF